MQRVIIVALIAAGCVLISATVVVLVVLLTKPKQEDNPPDTPDIVTPNYPLFQKANKQLYVWSHSIEKRIQGKPAWTLLIQNVDGSFDKLISFCETHNFKKIYLFAGSVEWEYEAYFSKGVFPYQEHLINDLEKLKQHRIQVELAVYLNDDPNNLTNYALAENVAQVAKSLQQKAEFTGLNWDQEPSNPGVYSDLLKMLKLSANNIHTSSTIKPLWLRQTVQNTLTQDQIDELGIQNTSEPFAQALCEQCDSGAMMAYSNNYDTISAYMEKIRAISSAVQKECVSIVETGFVNDLPEEETLCYEFKKDPSTFYKYVADKSAQYSAVAIHDYAQFYFDLYCEDASARMDIKNVC